MKQIFKQAVVGAGLALITFAVPAMAVEDVPSEPAGAVVLPQDEDALRSLEHQHRRILRTTIRQCAVGGNKSKTRLVASPCIISGVERGVDLADDPALRAYHEALPLNAVYDENRPQSIWRTVARRHAEAAQAE